MKKSDFKVGDLVVVYYKTVEGGKTRTYPFQGIVINKRGQGKSKTFTVRKVSAGIGVERIFPLSSPSLSKIKVKKKGAVRRSKLYYMRTRKGKRFAVKGK